MAASPPALDSAGVARLAKLREVLQISEEVSQSVAATVWASVRVFHEGGSVLLSGA